MAAPHQLCARLCPGAGRKTSVPAVLPLRGLPLLLSAIRATVQASEDRICRLLFKLAVEMDMMMNVLAAAMEIPEEQLRELRGRCVQEVKKTHGMISLDDAVEYQNGGD